MSEEMSKEVKSKKNMKWIERLGFPFTDYKEIEEEVKRFEIEVPVGAEFIGAQHDARILVMLVKDRYGATNPGRSNRNLEKRVVLRVKDGVMIKDMRAPHENESRYIGSDNMWHLFEVGAGLKFNTKVMNIPAVTVKES